MAETLAIVGAGGVLGSKLVTQALAAHADEAASEPRYQRIVAYTHGVTPDIPAVRSSRVVWRALEIGDHIAVEHALAETLPTVVINAAAMTNVDACETRRDEALAANANGPRALAEACRRLGAQLLHVSTDYVFDGSDTQPG